MRMLKVKTREEKKKRQKKKKEVEWSQNTVDVNWSRTNEENNSKTQWVTTE